MVWNLIAVRGTLKSKLTGETFEINESNKFYFNENGEVDDWITRTHAHGDKGMHAIMFVKSL